MRKNKHGLRPEYLQYSSEVLLVFLQHSEIHWIMEDTLHWYGHCLVLVLKFDVFLKIFRNVNVNPTSYLTVHLKDVNFLSVVDSIRSLHDRMDGFIIH